MFLVKGIVRNCELDLFEEGCQPNTGYSISWDVEFFGNTLEQVLEKVKEYHNVGDDDVIEIEGNKIYISVHEVPLDYGWVTPSKSDIEKWKRGEQEIYLVDYTYEIYCRYLFDTVVDDYENVLETARDAVRRLYEITEDKYCDNCFFFKVGWADSYKCFCNRFNITWTHYKEEKFPRQLICLLEGK